MEVIIKEGLLKQILSFLMFVIWKQFILEILSKKYIQL